MRSTRAFSRILFDYSRETSLKSKAEANGCLRELYENHIHFIESLFQDAIDKGKIKNLNVSVLAIALDGIIHNNIERIHRFGEIENFNELSPLIETILFDSILL